MQWEEPSDTGINWNGSGEFSPYNSMPTPYVEITMEEFMEKFITDVWGIQSENHRQVLNLVKGEMWTVKFLNYHDATYAAATHYMSESKAKNGTGYMFYRDGKNQYDSYTYFTRFYRIGCTHSIRGMTLAEIRERGLSNGMHDHNYICDKCGYSYSTESSG